jgi:hypothetical protein
MAFVDDAVPKRNGNYLTPAEYQILKESFERRLIADTKLSHSFLRVGIVVKWHMNQHSGDAWPGVKTIMKEARVGRATVYRALSYFEKMRHLDIERTPNRVNHYYPRPQEEQEAESHSYETSGQETPKTESRSYETGGCQSYETGGCQSYETRTFNEPSTEPLPYGSDEDIVPLEEGVKEEEKKAVAKEVRQESEEPPCSPDSSSSSLVSEGPNFPAPTWKGCYRFAREQFPGQSGEVFVGREFKRNAPVQWVWKSVMRSKGNRRRPR